MGILLNGIWWGFLRRWYGGLFPDETYKILGSRGLQTFVMMLSIFPVAFFQIKFGYELELYYLVICSLAVTCWIQFMFWSRGHGAILDEGRNKNPDISRYDRWFKIPLDFIWDKLLELKNSNKFFGWILQNWSGNKYGYSYDMCWTGCRYTLPMLPVAIFLGFKFLLIGMLVPLVYEFCIRIYERNTTFFNKFHWLNAGHKIAEIFTGFIFGILIII